MHPFSESVSAHPSTSNNEECVVGALSRPSSHTISEFVPRIRINDGVDNNIPVLCRGQIMRSNDECRFGNAAVHHQHMHPFRHCNRRILRGRLNHEECWLSKANSLPNPPHTLCVLPRFTSQSPSTLQIWNECELMSDRTRECSDCVCLPKIHLNRLGSIQKFDLWFTDALNDPVSSVHTFREKKATNKESLYSHDACTIRGGLGAVRTVLYPQIELSPSEMNKKSVLLSFSLSLLDFHYIFPTPCLLLFIDTDTGCTLSFSVYLQSQQRIRESESQFYGGNIADKQPAEMKIGKKQGKKDLDDVGIERQRQLVRDQRARHAV
ncbi:hypothetical protein BLNAU_5169 [Blattamonas nauphoetae]|uniref:Uncharacterized protein n=1 Tax=Blattamonas nauphoetae TaxID=2049346 RepID=A0ABQ9Y884_9EUKA|nr:hypothetical protein BLNAU_5169 [Blattamonas nauphoetae]